MLINNWKGGLLGIIKGLFLRFMHEDIFE